MKRVHASDFPMLRQFFGGYLHEEFVQEHGTPAGAMKAFEADADEDERRRLHREVTRFLEVTAPLDFAEVRLLLTRLGSRWTPATREDLIDVLIPKR